MGDAFVAPTGQSGRWPDPPAFWSHSTIESVEGCSRRYALEHGTYPDLWDRAGYPSRSSEASLFGDAVHRCVEVVLRSLASVECVSLDDARVVDVLRELGGLSAVTKDAIHFVLDRLRDNPRMKPRLPQLEAGLLRRAPEVRQLTQQLLSRVAFVPRPEAPSGPGDGGGSRYRGVGTHPEVTLRCDDLRFLGRIDLLVVTDEGAAIVDFKTGTPADHHSDQVRTYGLLWTRDTEANPASRPVVSLHLAYASAEESVEVPTDWSIAESAVVERVAASDNSLTNTPPVASPSPECRWCSVRHMCDEYWASPYVMAADRPRVDIEMSVVERNGAKSWMAESAVSGLLLVRTPTESVVFEEGARYRVLDVGLSQDDELARTVVSVSSSSEMYELAE